MLLSRFLCCPAPPPAHNGVYRDSRPVTPRLRRHRSVVHRIQKRDFHLFSDGEECNAFVVFKPFAYVLYHFAIEVYRLFYKLAVILQPGGRVNKLSIVSIDFFNTFHVRIFRSSPMLCPPPWSCNGRRVKESTFMLPLRKFLYEGY